MSYLGENSRYLEATRLKLFFITDRYANGKNEEIPSSNAVRGANTLNAFKKNIFVKNAFPRS